MVKKTVATTRLKPQKQPFLTRMAAIVVAAFTATALAETPSVVQMHGKQRKPLINKGWLMGVLFLLNLLVPSALHAWQKYIRFDRITIEQGLPDNYVRSVVQDKLGFMWFGTGNGLAKYDGYRFTVYQHDIDDPNSISSNEILYVFEDRQGTLWVGTDAGLNRFNREQETFSHFRHDPEDPSSLGGEVVATIYQDHDGILWVGHWFSGLSRFDPVNKSFERFHHDPEDPKSLPPGIVWAIHEDRSGIFWVGTYAREGSPDLTRFDRETMTFNRFFTCGADQAQCPQPITEADRPPIPQARTIFEDHAGNIWIGGFGLIKYDRASNTYKRYAHDPENINSPAGNNFAGNMVEDSSGLLWFADTFQGLTSFDPETEAFNRYQHDPLDPHSIASSDLFTLYQGRDGNIWAAAYQNGLSKFDPHSLAFGHYKHDPNDPNSLASNIVEAIAEDENGLLWIAAGGLNRVDRAAGVVTRFKHDPDAPDSLHTNDVRALHFDRAGSLWLGTIDGLSRFDPATGTFRYFPVDPKEAQPGDTGPRDVGVLSIAEDSDGFLWLGTNSTVARFDPDTGDITHYRANPDKPDALHGDSFAIGAIAGNGDVWIKSQSGINRFDPRTQKFTHYVHDPDNPSSIRQGPVTAILQSQDKVFWVGTSSGMDRFDSGTGVFTHFNNFNGAPIGSIDKIVSDSDGNLWISTRTKGLWKYTPASGVLKNYDASVGLAKAEIGMGLLSRSGELIFTSNDGINIFDPADLGELRQDTRVVITDFLLLNKSVPVSRTGRETPLSKHINETTDITLSYKDYLFSFEFAVPGYRYPEAVRYAYMLEGFDNDWVETGPDRRDATYTSVPPGEYVLRVKAAGRDGHWGESQSPIRLSILPPWWRTWWAYSLYVLAFVLTLFVYIRLRIMNLTRRARLLEQTVEERTTRIREHEQQIQRQAEDLEELLRLKEKLITNISHEFRTPLTLILGPARRLIQRAGDPRDVSQLQLIKRNSQRLLRLVDQLLGLARLGAEIPPVRSAQAVSATVDAITSSFQPLAKEKDLQLDVERNDELWTHCAPDALEKILLNLLSNAIKYTPAGGRITVSTRAGDDNTVEVSVSDTGIGIPADEHEAVFERFHRVGDSGESIPGAGIGLALVRELVLAHGGRISLSSQLGEGTTVTVKLPRCEAGLPQVEKGGESALSEAVTLEIEALAASADRPVSASIEEVNGKPSILIVEDNVDLQHYIVDLLADTYQCAVAGDGEDALEFAYEHIPDLVLLDLMLPKLDGFQVSHALKEDERTSHIPIIMLTARNDRDSRMESWKEKVDGYLTKPFDDDELRMRIANLLEIRDILKCRFSTEFFADARPHQAVDQIENGFMKKLEQVLECCHSEPEFGSTQMAAEMFMSARQLQRKLKAITGHHPAELLRSYRLRKARELLQAGMPVGLTADTVGFSSPTYFTSCFKAQFGQTPSEFQTGHSGRVDNHSTR